MVLMQLTIKVALDLLLFISDLSQLVLCRFDALISILLHHQKLLLKLFDLVLKRLALGLKLVFQLDPVLLD